MSTSGAVCLIIFALAACAAIATTLLAPTRPATYTGRHTDVASVPGPAYGTDARQTAATQREALAELVRTAELQAAPWPDAEQPGGWPVFATCADIPVIWDGPSPARPYVAGVVRPFEYRGGEQ